VASLEEIRAGLRERLDAHKGPFHVVDVPAAHAAIDRLTSVDGEHWGAVWSDAARPFEERARALEAAGDRNGARDAYFIAYGMLHVARFPTPNSPAKVAAYRRSVEMYRAAGRFFTPPLEVVTVPFAGRAGEGDAVTFYVRRQSRREKAPVLIRWGGIDTWKEERHDINERVLAAGFTSITVDMPGVGDAPVRGSVDAERQFVPLLDWIGTQPDLDAERVAIVGMSYGGYWATKVAHLYADRLCAAVNWGGGIHTFFTRAWNERSKNASSYVMDLDVARARTVGADDYAWYIERVAGFSLVDEGILDRPHPPMLIVNGRHDEQVPLDDMLVLCEHGAPKELRLFPGGHMGYGPNTLPTVLAWLQKITGARAALPA
jgi:esterase FrsA